MDTKNTAKDTSPIGLLEDQERYDNYTKTRPPYDLIIFGASGAVGKFLVEEMALVVEKHYSDGTLHQNKPYTPNESRSSVQFAQNRRGSVPRRIGDIAWAIAGRSAMRLSDTLCQAELSTGIKGLSNDVPVILADLEHHRSLLEMCHKTSLLITCAGPYSQDGEALIRACIETKTNYIDLAHESTFIERMRQTYSDQAKKAGVYIINGCGFQSMSAEMGLNFLKRITDGQIEQVKIIMSLSDSKAILTSKGSDAKNCAEFSGIVTPGMWQSWLLDRTNEISTNNRISANEPKKLKPSRAMSEYSSEKQVDSCNPQKPLLRQDTQTLVRNTVEFKNRKSFTWLEMLAGYNETSQGYCVPTNSFTSEESQLIRGEMVDYEHRKPDLDSERGWRPIRCTSFLSLRSFYEVLLTIIWLLVINIFIKFSLTRRLMKAFPVIASLGHVSSTKSKLTRNHLSHIKFCQTFVVYGTPGDESGDPLEKREKYLKRKQEQLLVARVVGPEPNHVATATYAIQAALTIMTETDHLPREGGLMTPGVAFSETNIIYQLRRRNIKFEVLKKA